MHARAYWHTAIKFKTSGDSVSGEGDVFLCYRLTCTVICNRLTYTVISYRLTCTVICYRLTCTVICYRLTCTVICYRLTYTLSWWKRGMIWPRRLATPPTPLPVTRFCWTWPKLGKDIGSNWNCLLKGCFVLSWSQIWFDIETGNWNFLKEFLIYY